MDGVYENVHATALNTSASYNPFSSHHHLPSTSYSKDSSSSWKVNNHQHHEDRDDDDDDDDENTDEERDFSVPASADDDALNDSDRPKLLMWGLTK